MYRITPPYTNIEIANQSSCEIADHMGGFDVNLQSHVLDELALKVSKNNFIFTEYIFDEAVKKNYPILNLVYDQNLWIRGNFVKDFLSYTQHPNVQFSNFLCSFNGTPHVGRKLLVSILKKFNFFDPAVCSKNFSFSTSVLDGHLADYLSCDQLRVYRKFFICESCEDFFHRQYSFGHVRYNHATNITLLATKITSSFLHIISETVATSYYPFVTEKFLYSVVTRGLFLAWAQPGWHSHVEKYYGFKPYTKLFDYSFDTMQNPVHRLVELLTMISKFSVLSVYDWRDLYDIEKDTIEYNYDHYFSQDFLKVYQNKE